MYTSRRSTTTCLTTSSSAMETTTIFQYSTGTPLAASSDDSKDSALIEMKRKLRGVVSAVTNGNEQPAEGSLDADTFTVHYRADHDNDIVVVAVTKAGFPSQLVASYIAELHGEFTHVYTPEMTACASRGETLRPYQFMSFETFISKTKRVYADARAKDGLTDVSHQLRDVKNIMHRNISDLLNRGEELNELHNLSSTLKSQSEKYKKYAGKINWDLFVKKWTPVAIVGFFVLLLVIYRWFI